MYSRTHIYTPIPFNFDLDEATGRGLPMVISTRVNSSTRLRISFRPATVQHRPS